MSSALWWAQFTAPDEGGSELPQSKEKENDNEECSMGTLIQQE